MHLSVNSENGKAEDEILVDYNYMIWKWVLVRNLQELTSSRRKNVEFSFKSSGDPALMKDIEDEGAIMLMPMRV